MIEADPLAIATLVNDVAQIALQAGPPVDLPAQVPDFVSGILEAVGNAAGDGGLGETISELTPGGSGETAGAGADTAAGSEQPSS